MGAFALTTAIAATVALTACSGTKVATGVASRCPAVAGISSQAVTYGLLYPTSGIDSETFVPYRAGVDARLGVANAQGGVFGRQIHYDWVDEGGQTKTNLAGAQELVDRENDFLVQEFGSSPQGSAAWLNQNGIPVVGTANDPVWAKYRNMFSYFNIFTPTGSISTWGDYAARYQHVHKAAILYSRNTSDGARTVGLAVQKSMESAGIQAVMIDVQPTQESNPAEILQAIKDSGADLLSGFLDGDAFFKIAIAARAQQSNLKILSLVGYDPGILAAGRALAGMSIFIGYQPFERPVPAQRKFLAAMAEYAPQQQPAANEIALIGWIDTDLLLRGLQAAGPCPTRQSFITNLRAVSGYDAGGLLTSPVDLTRDFGKLTLCYSFVQISLDGTRFQPVGDKPLCGRALD